MTRGRETIIKINFVRKNIYFQWEDKIKQKRLWIWPGAGESTWNAMGREKRKGDGMKTWKKIKVAFEKGKREPPKYSWEAERRHRKNFIFIRPWWKKKGTLRKRDCDYFLSHVTLHLEKCQLFFKTISYLLENDGEECLKTSGRGVA